MNDKLAIIIGTFVLQIAALQAELDQARSELAKRGKK